MTIHLMFILSQLRWPGFAWYWEPKAQGTDFWAVLKDVRCRVGASRAGPPGERMSSTSRNARVEEMAVSRVLPSSQARVELGRRLCWGRGKLRWAGLRRSAQVPGQEERHFAKGSIWGTYEIPKPCVRVREPSSVVGEMENKISCITCGVQYESIVQTLGSISIQQEQSIELRTGPCESEALGFSGLEGL